MTEEDCCYSAHLSPPITEKHCQMLGQKPSFTANREITNLELPKRTVIEIELVTERVGEVCQWATCVSHKSSVLTGSCPAFARTLPTLSLPIGNDM